MNDHEIFRIPAFKTQSGFTLNVDLAYRTYGRLAPASDNVVVIPTFYAGRHPEAEYMCAPGRAIDLDR